MRFLFISYNFSPEKTGIGKYNGEWAEWLVNKGHSVDVITSYPYYPEWKVHEDYKGKIGYMVERKERFNVFRCPMYIPKGKGGFGRLLSDFSFAATSFFAFLGAILLNKRYDVVVAVSPSMLNGILPTILKRTSGTAFVYHIQDLQLDAAVELGLIKNKMLEKILLYIEKFQLKSSSIVSSISEGMRKKIVEKGVSPDNYFMLENWVDTEFIKPGPIEKILELKAELGIPLDRRIILYSGNLGIKQGVEILIDIAGLLKSEEDWLFVVCGDGMAREGLIAEAKRTDLKNILFCPLQSYQRLPQLLQMADIHLIPQKKAAADLVLPSKLSGILSIGGVVIACAEENTELYNIIRENNIGYTVEPENPSALAHAIRHVMKSDTSVVTQNAREFAIKRFGKDLVLSRFCEVADKLVNFREMKG